MASKALRAATSGVDEELFLHVIQHYAFKGNKKAQETLSKTNKAGVRAMAHSLTGWKPAKQEIEISQSQVLLEMCKTLAALRGEIFQVKEAVEANTEQIQENRDDIAALSQRLDSYDNYFSLTAYFKYKKMSCPDSKLSVMGKRMTQFCREGSIEMGSVPHPRWGSINTYPEEVIEKHLKHWGMLD